MTRKQRRLTMIGGSLAVLAVAAALDDVSQRTPADDGHSLAAKRSVAECPRADR